MIKKIVLILLFILVFFPQVVYSGVGEDSKYFEAEKNQEVEGLKLKPPSLEKKLSFRAGGWYNFMFRFYKNDDNEAGRPDLLHSINTQDLRLWSILTYENKFSFYIRMKNLLTQRSMELGYSEPVSCYQGPSVDSMYFLYKYPNWQVQLGRQYLFIGRGIAYDGINDGVKHTLMLGKFYTKMFYAQTKPRDDNVDTSVPNYRKKGQRYFWGVEVSYLGVPENVFYAYFLGQRDGENWKKDPPSQQKYGYDSEYYGLGLEGKKREFLRYWWELIRERGRNYTDGYYVAVERKHVDAWAMDTGIRFATQIFTHPYLEGEYSFGSGDKDRTSVVRTERGGNRYGNDENFLYFGNYFGGYASRFRLSNLHIWKVEIGCKPLEKFFMAKEVTFGMKYYVYSKDKPSGWIYDGQALGAKSYVGQEMNVYMYCPLNKYVYCSFRYGLFFPGDVYINGKHDNAQYSSAAITISF